MIKEKILVSNNDSEKLDKVKIALAIRNAVHGNSDLSCSLLDKDIISGCSNCSLNFLCKKIDEAEENYRKSITTVISNFSF